jgi:hypothetical protein
MNNIDRHIKNFQKLIDRSYWLTLNHCGAEAFRFFKDFRIKVREFDNEKIYLEVYYYGEVLPDVKRLIGYFYNMEDWIIKLIGTDYILNCKKYKLINQYNG